MQLSGNVGLGVYFFGPLLFPYTSLDTHFYMSAKIKVLCTDHHFYEPLNDCGEGIVKHQLDQSHLSLPLSLLHTHIHTHTIICIIMQIISEHLESSQKAPALAL